MLLQFEKSTCQKCHATFQKNEGSAITLCLDCQFGKEEAKNSPQEIIIKPELLDISKLSESNESREFRPKIWEEYIGQESAKNKVISYVDGCKKFNETFPHTFISAPSGMGKTLFATILANQLGKKIIFTTGGELKSEQIFIDKLIEAEGGIIFVDEANRLPKKVGFYILPLMEQFEVQGRPIKKFSVFFATTHIGDLSKDLDALIQRCERINLEPYKNEELLEIVRQYQQKQYPLNKIPDNILLEIVKSCRQTPRNAKNLVRAYVYTQDWNKVKQYNNIIKDGITLLDVRVLKYLQQSGGAGKGSIANSIRVKPQTYEFEVEPFLIYKEFIEVSNRRKLSNQGREFLNEII